MGTVNCTEPVDVNLPAQLSTDAVDDKVDREASGIGGIRLAGEDGERICHAKDDHQIAPAAHPWRRFVREDAEPDGSLAEARAICVWIDKMHRRQRHAPARYFASVKEDQRVAIEPPTAEPVGRTPTDIRKGVGELLVTAGAGQPDITAGSSL